jgi:uroporphyrinogen III methyltransferase/synthase
VTARPVVAVTRDAESGSELADALRARGFEVWSVPAIVIEPVPAPGELEAALADPERFDWVVFTSPRAVDTVCTRPGWIEAWPRMRARARVAAVGPGTAARLEAYGVPAATVASGTGASLPDAMRLQAHAMAGLELLWPRGDRARTGWRDALERAGARVTAPIAYTTTLAPIEAVAPLVSALDAGRIAAVTFLSPSSADGIARACPGGTLALLKSRTIVAAIGSTTAERLAELGAPPEVVADAPAPGALADALADYLSGLPSSQPRRASS